jgi:hypothetical protein
MATRSSKSGKTLVKLTSEQLKRVIGGASGPQGMVQQSQDAGLGLPSNDQGHLTSIQHAYEAGGMSANPPPPPVTGGGAGTPVVEPGYHLPSATDPLQTDATGGTAGGLTGAEHDPASSHPHVISSSIMAASVTDNLSYIPGQNPADPLQTSHGSEETDAQGSPPQGTGL